MNNCGTCRWHAGDWSTIRMLRDTKVDLERQGMEFIGDIDEYPRAGNCHLFPQPTFKASSDFCGQWKERENAEKHSPGDWIVSSEQLEIGGLDIITCESKCKCGCGGHFARKSRLKAGTVLLVGGDPPIEFVHRGV